MKILYIGNVWLSYKLLKIIIRCKIDVVGVITTKKSKFNSDYRDLTDLCKTNKINLHYTKKINSKKTVLWIRKKSPDYIFCFGWSQILGKDILNIPTKHVVGFHPTKLPLYRGRHPIIWSIILGLKETASSFFIINKDVDDGPIISQKNIQIKKNETSYSLYLKIIKHAEVQVKNIVNAIKKNKIKIKKNIKLKKSYLRKRNFLDGKIDWRMRAVDIDRLVRALGKPYPGAHIIHEDRVYKIWQTKIIKNNESFEPGKVIANVRNKPIVKCTDASIKIIESEPLLKLGDIEYI